MAYTTVDLVSAELNGVIISSTTAPSSTTVTNWITEEDSNIDLMTGQTWTSTTVTDEAYDYDGSGYLRLLNAPVISLTSTSYEANGIGASSESWTDLTEGRTNDYIAYLSDGELDFISSVPAGKQNVKVSYVYGYDTTPGYIQRLATLKVVQRFISAGVNSSAKDEGGSVSVGDISISDPSNFSADYVKSIDTEIRHIIDYDIGKSKVHRKKRYYNKRQ